MTAPHLSISRGAWEPNFDGHHRASMRGPITEETICKLKNNSTCWTSPVAQPAPRRPQLVSPSSPRYLKTLLPFVTVGWSSVSLPYCPSLEQSHPPLFNFPMTNFSLTSIREQRHLEWFGNADSVREAGDGQRWGPSACGKGFHDAFLRIPHRIL